MTASGDVHVVVTAVHAETRAVLDGLRRIRRIDASGFRAWEGESDRARVRVVQSGIGPDRAGQALAAMPTPYGLVLCVGFAGALSDAAPGDIVLPHRVIWEGTMQSDGYDVPTDIRERARRALATVPSTRIIEEPLLSSPAIMASPETKRAAHARTGAVAVEMETAGLLPIALSRNAAVLPLRVVLDTVDVSLEAVPPDLESSWRARARLVGRPRAWRAVWMLAREIPTASAKLRTACSVVLASL